MKSLALSIASFFLFLLSLGSLSRRRVWWIRGLDFPRLQIGALAAAAAVAARKARSPLERVAALAALASSVFQMAHVIPYSFFYKRQVKRARSVNSENILSLMVANVQMTNRRAEALLGLVEYEQPDLLLVLEPDEWWDEQLRSLWYLYPRRVCQPQSNTYGIALFSQLELVRPQILERVTKGVPSISTRVVLRSGVEVELRAVHPEPPAPHDKAQPTSKQRDAELQLVGREVADINRPVIVAGDLNDVAWSHSTRLFQRVSHLLDPRRGRGLFNTYHAKIPFMRWPLDHIFHSPNFTLLEMRRLPRIGSDHFPMYVKLAYDPSAERVQEKPSVKGDDLKESQEMLRTSGRSAR